MNDKKVKTELQKLAKEVNKHHKEAGVCLLNSLEHARQCGDYLIQAKSLLKHGQWIIWLRKNFSFSYETAANYKRVAESWNDDFFIEARQDGNIFTSIDSVLVFLRNKKAEEQTAEQVETSNNISDTTVHSFSSKSLSDEQKKAAIARCNLRQTFDSYLKSLTMDEVLMFEIIFNQLETGWWEIVVNRLHHLVCSQLEYDPYEVHASSDTDCPMLNKQNISEYFKYVANHSQDGNNLIDRRRKYQISELTKKYSRRKTLLAANRNKMSAKRVKELEDCLAECDAELNNLNKFMEN